MNRSKLRLALLGGIGAAVAARQAMRLSRRICLTGKVVLITGGSRGLGLAMARQFAAKGARVAICARDAAELDRARDDLAGRGAQVYTVTCDVTVPLQVATMLAAVKARLGPTDILVNNAGIIAVGPLETMTLADFQEAMNVNFWSTVYTTLAVLPEMRSRGAGRIVNISSIGGKIPVPHLLPYCASKFAVTGFSEGLRAELMKDGIYVTTVCPGLMRTGSPPNADFKGQHRKEYAWFSIGDSIPGLSMSAARAARQVVSACQHGVSEVTLGLPAKLAVRIHGVLPGIDTELQTLASRLLPSAGGIGTAKAKGHESYSAASPSVLTTLTERAKIDLNEIPAGRTS